MSCARIFTEYRINIIQFPAKYLYRIWELELKMTLRFYRQCSYRIKYQPI